MSEDQQVLCLSYSLRLAMTGLSLGRTVEGSDKQKRIISSIHDANHLGVHRTNNLVSKKYYWPNLYKDITAYVSI